MGASVFYKDVSGGESGPMGPRKKRGSRSSLERLEQELKVRSSKKSHAKPSSGEEGTGFLLAEPLAFHAVVESKHPKYTSVLNYNLSEKVFFCTLASLTFRFYSFISICILKAFTRGLFMHHSH